MPAFFIVLQFAEPREERERDRRGELVRIIPGSSQQPVRTS